MHTIFVFLLDTVYLMLLASLLRPASFIALSSQTPPTTRRRSLLRIIFSSSASFIAAQSPPTSASCRATTPTMTAEDTTSNNAPSLPRWDLGRFGFASPFSDDIDSHLGETAKLAESFKVRL